MDIVNNQSGQDFAIKSSLSNSNKNISVAADDESQVSKAERDKQASGSTDVNEQAFQDSKESEKAVKILQATKG
ncbi:MAG: hypothetical protein CL595_03125 [Alteromonas sp.]|nr:hypothetical protein [Alteromonas sp.]